MCVCVCVRVSERAPCHKYSWVLSLMLRKLRLNILYVNRFCQVTSLHRVWYHVDYHYLLYIIIISYVCHGVDFYHYFHNTIYFQAWDCHRRTFWSTIRALFVQQQLVSVYNGCSTFHSERKFESLMVMSVKRRYHANSNRFYHIFCIHRTVTNGIPFTANYPGWKSRKWKIQCGHNNNINKNWLMTQFGPPNIPKHVWIAHNQTQCNSIGI